MPDRSDAAAMDEHVQVLGNVAVFFAQELGRPELMELLTGPRDANPIVLLQQELQRGLELRSSQPEAAAEAGARVLHELDQIAATGGLEEEQGVASYLVGVGAFSRGDAPAARAQMEQAIRLFRAARTMHPVALANDLFDVYRYLGEADRAAAIAHGLAGRLSGDAGLFYQRQEEILRAGEPLLRMVARAGQVRYEIADAPLAFRAASAPMKLTIEFWRNRPSIDRSVRLTRRGTEHASKGEFAPALAAFGEAHRVDPYDPHPIYQTGTALLDMGRWAEARDAFATVEALAPGWFFARRLGWLADEIAAGSVPPQIGMVAIRADDNAMSAESRLRLLAPALADVPDLGMLHLYAGEAEGQLGRQAESIAHLRRGLEARGDPDVRSALLVRLAYALGTKRAEGRELLEAAVTTDGSPYTTATARLALWDGDVAA